MYIYLYWFAMYTIKWIRLTVKPTKLTCEITEPKSVEVNLEHDNQKVWTEENEKEMLNLYKR